MSTNLKANVRAVLLDELKDLLAEFQKKRVLLVGEDSGEGRSEYLRQRVDYARKKLDDLRALQKREKEIQQRRARIDQENARHRTQEKSRSAA